MFCGNLDSSFLILVSRVRLIDPNESFYTSSSHRLRDSHVGRAGHWVDIEVRGDCSVAELALIERLARATDTRLSSSGGPLPRRRDAIIADPPVYPAHTVEPPVEEGADRRAGRTAWQGPEDGV